jgi:hypothetical protein
VARADSDAAVSAVRDASTLLAFDDAGDDATATRACVRRRACSTTS